MATAQNQQDVIISYDAQDRNIVDRYAKALAILDGDNTDNWVYTSHVIDGNRVHYATLVGDSDLDVVGTQPLSDLTPATNYNIFLEYQLLDDSVGFTSPVKMDLTDSNGKVTTTSAQLTTGTNKVSLGPISSNPGSSSNVSVRMYNKASQVKSGLIVRRLNFTPVV